MGSGTSSTACCSSACFSGLVQKMRTASDVRRRNRDSISFLFDCAVSVKEQSGDICFLAHGMGGSEHDWDTWIEILPGALPAWRLHPLKDLAEGTRFCGDTVCKLAITAAREMIGIIEDEMKAHMKVIKLHCIGHSMGGLILRAALPSIIEHFSSKGQCARLAFGHYMSLSTPHMGVQSSWACKDLWKNFGWLASYASNQVPQLTLHDDHDGGGPFLARLCEKDGPYMKCLQGFQRRTCVTLASGDALIPLPSGVIDPSFTVTDSSASHFQSAEWWFGQMTGLQAQSSFAKCCEELKRARSDRLRLSPENSINLVYCSRPVVYSEADIKSPPSRISNHELNKLSMAEEGFTNSHSFGATANNVKTCEALAEVKLADARSPVISEWKYSDDWTCYYPQVIYDSLNTLDWQRVVVEMTHPPLAKNAHVFLIGKQSEQWELEHAMSKECVHCICKIFMD